MKKVWLLALLLSVSPWLFAEEAAPEGVFVTLTRTSLSQNDLPANTEVLTPETFKTWSAQTAGEAARRLTSVQVQPVGGLGTSQTLQIRGASTSQNLVLIDGRPMGSIAFGASQDLTEIPVESIQRVEVVRGGVSALYGPNAMGGVLNIITKRAPSDGRATGSAGYEYGSYDRNIFRASAGGKSGPADVFVYGNTQHEGGFRHNSRADTLNVGANLGLALPPGAGKLTLDGSYYQSEIGLPGLLFLPTNQFDTNAERVATTPNAKQTSDTHVLRAGYTVPLPANSLLSVKAWGSERRVIFKDSFSDTDRLEYTRGTSAQVDLPYGLTVGGEFIHDREDSLDRLTPSNNFMRFVENYAFFAQETFKWKPFTLIPSGRFDHHSGFGDTANPRVQLLADVTPWLRLSGSSARSFRAPTIDDLYYPYTDFGTFSNGFGGYTQFTYQGNPNLHPETAWTYDAGFELHHEAASFKASYFRANVSNLIQTVNTFTSRSSTLANPDVYASQTFNVGKARRQGAELQAEHRLNAHLKESLNYTYLENVGVPSGYSDYVLLAYSPRHTVNAAVTVSPTSAWDWTNNLRYVDKRFSSNNQGGTKLGSMVLWDMRVAYRWNKLESYVQVNDLNDRRYQEQAGYPLPGRTFLGGVTVHF